MEVGDEHRLYFSGQPTSHGYGWTPEWKGIPRWVDYLKRYPASGITFASWPKWQLFGFESDPEGAFRIHLGTITQPSELRLNYEIIKPEGCIRAEVHSEGGTKVHTFENSHPLTRGSIGETLTWKTGTLIPPTPSASLFLQLENARVYAYDVRQ